MGKTSSFLNTWGEKTSCHGVPDLTESSGCPGKTFWTVVMLTMLGVASWQVTAFKTSISYRKTKFPLFPNITICNYNQFHRNRSAELGVTAGVAEELNSAIPNGYDSNSMYFASTGMYQSTAWADFYADPAVPEKDTDKLIRYVGMSCRETVFLCQFNGGMMDCCNDSVEILNNNGKCLVINPKPLSFVGYPTQIDNTPSTGFRAFLSTASHKALDGPFFNMNMEKGFIVYVNHNPFDPYPTGGVVVGANQKAYIQLSQEADVYQQPKLPVFRPDCVQEAENEYLSADYTQVTCTYECILRRMLAAEGCGCVFPFEYKTPLPVCNATLSRACSGANVMTGVQGCFGECLDPCEERASVAVASTSIHWPDAKFKETPQLRQTLTFLARGDSSYSMEDLLSISVYDKGGGVLVRQVEEKTTIISLISNVGGQLGLWMGVSIVTIVQLLYIAAVTCFCPKIHPSPSDSQLY